jgi:hypothetical protein
MADNVTRGSKISDCNIGEISKYSPYKYIIYNEECTLYEI